MPLIVHPGGYAQWKTKRLRCALGRSGIASGKREGDGVTPDGRFPFREVFYRADRVATPNTSLPCRAIDPSDGWCDDPAHAHYNCRISRPFDASHESLMREDGLYDVIVVLGYNDDPVEPGRGSAIFLHVATPDFSPTEGCVALPLDDLLAVIAEIGPDDVIDIRLSAGT